VLSSRDYSSTQSSPLCYFQIKKSIINQINCDGLPTTMKIRSLHVENIPPIKNLSLKNLEDIVIIAGANGSGKSNLKQAIINSFINPSSPVIDMTIQSTKSEETERWKNENIQLTRGQQNTEFVEYMNSRTRGGTYTGSVIQIDSQRNLNPVIFQPLNLSVPDPDDVEIDNKYFLNQFTNRWQDVVNKIYQKKANWNTKLINYLKEHPTKTLPEAIQKNPDPFTPYQQLFVKLLPGKELEEIDPKNPREFTYTTNGATLPFETLSSGEQEVIKITFDLLAKKMGHCVFLIDEPELHLHPTLTFRLIETLREMAGGTNQFFFFTHSADLISTYYATGNVYFIEAVKNGENEARNLQDIDSSHSTLAQVLGKNLGIFAVGKKIIFVEGETSSIDRLTYHAIAQKYYQEAYVTPIGSVNDMPVLSRLSGEIENRVYGIDFFIIRDRDGLTEANIQEIEANGKMRCLRKRCLENYFLDAEILAKVAERFCIQDDNLKNPTYIKTKLKEAAARFLNHNIQLSVKEYVSLHAGIEKPSVASVETKTVSAIQTEYSTALNLALQERAGLLSAETIAQKFTEISDRLNQALTNDNWLSEFSGKEIFASYSSTYLRTPKEQVREAYIEIALEEKTEVFQDIIAIFEHFKSC
jgi:predicted ATP-dependent endonuclease of OLD family